METPPLLRPTLSINDLLRLDGHPIGYVRVQDILNLTGDGNYTQILSRTHRLITCPQTLLRFEERLPESHFVRLSKSMIVAISSIKSFYSNGSRYMEVLLESGQTYAVARRRIRIVKNSITEYNKALQASNDALSCVTN